MVKTEGLIYFAKVMATGGQSGITALVAVYESHKSNQVSDDHFNGYLYGRMDEAMRNNPVLSMMDEWDFLEDSWKPLDVIGQTTIIL